MIIIEITANIFITYIDIRRSQRVREATSNYVQMAWQKN